MKRSILTISLLAAACMAQAARADSDVSPGVANNKIVTGGWDDDAAAYTAPPVSAFDFDFGGDDPLQPFFTEDPGFHAKDGFFPSTAIPFIPNSTLRFNIQSDLLYWDGTGPEIFAPAPAGTLLTLDKGSFSVTVGTGETLPKTGLLLSTSDSGGNIHEHIGSTLSNAFGDPAPGFYRFDLTLYTDTPGIAPSDPISITYALTPEPAALGIFALGVCFTAHRRRGAPRSV